MRPGIKITKDEAQSRLQGIFDRGGNLSGLMRFFGQYMKRSIDRNFTAGGRPIPWPALKLGTLSGWAVSKKSFTTKKGLLSKTGREALAGRKRLINSGLLMNATFYVAGGNSLAVINDNAVAAIQHFGAKIPPIYPRTKKALAWPGLAYPVKHTRGAIVPPSPFMMFQGEDIVYFNQLYVNYLLTGSIG